MSTTRHQTTTARDHAMADVSAALDDLNMLARHRDVITDQTKTRERVRELAEVYTHEREVNAMLDLVPDMFPSPEYPKNISRKFLEPACGSGNFLVAILERKLAFVTTSVYRSDRTFETAILTALSSIYGIDIDASNIEDCRAFMGAEIFHHVKAQGRDRSASNGFWSAVDEILSTNIIRADTLADAHKIELVEYHWQRKAGFVLREWTFLEQPANDQLDLFGGTPAEPRRDEVAIHYGELAEFRAPVTLATPVRMPQRSGEPV